MRILAWKRLGVEYYLIDFDDKRIMRKWSMLFRDAIVWGCHEDDPEIVNIPLVRRALAKGARFLEMSDNDWGQLL